MVEKSIVSYRLSWLRLLLASGLEPLIRGIALFSFLIGKDREGIELVIRGLILGGKYKWKVGRAVRFVGPSRNFYFGSNVTFYGNTYLNANGENGRIEIGANSHLDQFCVIYGQGGVFIEGDAAISAGVYIYSQSNSDQSKDGKPVSRQPVIYSPVHIGAGCWMGAGSRILPGVRLENKVHVGAGAVVIKDVASNTTVVGVPARPMK